ncbi:MAG: ASTRA complex subunit [Vezdaea acicularis]|nr:MAG: ASTRA complex subunit [Vezdaea acicularis]
MSRPVGQAASTKSLPPAQPVYVLRGHSCAVHVVQFYRSNSRLFTADADGWAVIWNLATKRAVAVWRAHENAVLGFAAWGEDRILTHGRDHRLFVWQLGSAEEGSLSKVLPVDDTASHRPQPWLLHALSVNTLNFCSFALSPVRVPALVESAGTSRQWSDVADAIVVAVPNSLNSDSIDVFHLPSEARIHTIPADSSEKTGMVMSLSMFHVYDRLLTLAAGFESGHVIVVQHSPPTGGWHTLYAVKPHSQPVLGLALLPDLSAFFTSAADAIIAKHPLPHLDSAAPQDAKRSPAAHEGCTSAPDLARPAQPTAVAEAAPDLEGHDLQVEIDGEVELAADLETKDGAGIRGTGNENEGGKTDEPPQPAGSDLDFSKRPVATLPHRVKATSSPITTSPSKQAQDTRHATATSSIASALLTSPQQPTYPPDLPPSPPPPHLIHPAQSQSKSTPPEARPTPPSSTTRAAAPPPTNPPSALSKLLSPSPSSSATPISQPPPPSPAPPQEPLPSHRLKVVQTHHAGQQSLRVRSDGALFATAGWDGRIRVYSARGMRELAVLRWGGGGVSAGGRNGGGEGGGVDGWYAVAFGEVLDDRTGDRGGEGGEGVLVKRNQSVAERREEKVRAMHWVAGGRKDGRVVLWDIY